MTFPKKVPKVQEFGYLYSLIKGKTKEMFGSLSFMNKNYKIATELRKHYGQSATIKQKLHKQLRNIWLTNEIPELLRQTIDKQNKILRQLQMLSIDVSLSDWNSTMLEKYPANIVIEVWRVKPDGTTLDDLPISVLLRLLLKIMKKCQEVIELCLEGKRNVLKGYWENDQGGLMGWDDIEDNRAGRMTICFKNRRNQPTVHLENQNYHASFAEIYILMMSVRNTRHTKTAYDLFRRRDYVSNVFRVDTTWKDAKRQSNVGIAKTNTTLLFAESIKL